MSRRRISPKVTIFFILCCCCCFGVRLSAFRVRRRGGTSLHAEVRGCGGRRSRQATSLHYAFGLRILGGAFVEGFEVGL